MKLNASHVSLALLVPLIGGLFVAVGHMMQDPAHLSDLSSWRDILIAVMAICGLAGATLPSWLYVLTRVEQPPVPGEMPVLVDPTKPPVPAPPTKPDLPPPKHPYPPAS